MPEEHKTLVIFLRNDVPVLLAVLAAADEAGADAQPVTAVSVAGSAEEIRRVDLPMPDLTEFTIGLAVEFPEKSGAMTLDRVELLVDLADENARIHVMSRTANSVEVEVRDLPGPRILSHIDSRYPGWRAYIDGAEVSILTAFSHFKAVEMPAGTHRVRFEFRPRLVYVCLAISLVSLVIWIAALTCTFKRPARTYDSKTRSE